MGEPIIQLARKEIQEIITPVRVLNRLREVTPEGLREVITPGTEDRHPWETGELTSRPLTPEIEVRRPGVIILQVIRLELLPRGPRLPALTCRERR